MSHHVRLATLDDAPSINAINRTSLGYDYPLDSTCRQLERVLKRPTDRVFVVCDDADGHVKGFLHAADYETIHTGSMKNIISLAVKTDARGLGLGRLLLNAAESWARQDGCEAVRLVSSFERVNAHAFYLHCGYQLRKEQKNFIRHL